jgi:hypothetical protein
MKLLHATILSCCLLLNWEPCQAKETCTHTWGKGPYKTYGQIQSEVRNKFGNVKILRLALCGGTGQHYFRVVVLQTPGTVKSVQIPAR